MGMGIITRMLCREQSLRREEMTRCETNLHVIASKY